MLPRIMLERTPGGNRVEALACSPYLRLYWGVSTARSCSVSFKDSEGITHSVEITASSLFEAAVVALAEFRKHGFTDATFGPATTLNVRVKAPEASHVVSIGQVKAWLDRVGKSPREQVEKNRLKYLLTR